MSSSSIDGGSVQLSLKAPLSLPKNNAAIATVVAFLLLYAPVLAGLARDWWDDPDAAHGLLLVPLAVYIGWKRGVAPGSKPQAILGTVFIGAAVVLTYLAELAAEVFTLRASMLLAAAGIVVFLAGFRQVLRWWLPAALIALSVPLPDVVLSTIALPLQLKASAMGAYLLEWRHVPVMLNGNIIRLPTEALFVTEACSGLRSLSALIALGLLMGSMFLQTSWARVLVLFLSVPIAMLINGFRVFLTGYLVHFGSPKLGTGFMHLTEGWILFMVAFAALGGVTAMLARGERMLSPRSPQ